MAAKISDACAGCGVCVDACPCGAISVNGVAVVDESACVDCGACVDACPCDAISVD